MIRSFHDQCQYNLDLNKNLLIVSSQTSTFYLQDPQIIKLKNKLMKIQVFILVLKVSLIICQQGQIKCHYSCQTCVGQSYTLCTKCIENKNITLVEDPQISQKQYINSNSVSGVCTGDIPPKANALGILILIICAGIAIAIRTPYSIYLISTLQSLSLIGFVEIAWVNPVGYLWQSLQYFMIFTWLGSGFKIQDQTMRQRQYYRLDVYFHESSFLRNFAIIGIFNLILVILIVLLSIYKYKKDKQQNKSKLFQILSQKSKRHEQKTENNINLVQNPIIENMQQSKNHQQKENNELHENKTYHEQKKQQQSQQTTMDRILQIAHKTCLTIFYLLIQQSSLIIMVSLRFQRPISLAVKGIAIIYCICLLCFLVYIFIYKLWIFPNFQAQFANIWRKIGLPVLVIVPYHITFLIVVFMLIFFFIQAFFQYRGVGYKLISRISLYKLIQLIVIILAGAYILTQLNQNIQLQTNIIRVFLAIGILAFFVCFILETVFGIIQTYCLNKNSQNQVANSNKDQIQHKNELNCTQQGLNNQGNIFDPNKKKIVIQDLQNQQNNNNDDQERARKIKEQQQKRKKQLQQQNQRKLKQQQERKRKEEEQRKKREQQQRRKKQQQDKRRQQQQRKNRQQQEKRKRQQLERKKQQEERQRERKRQQERKRRQQQQARRKQQEQARKKKLQQQLRRKKQEQQQARKRKLQQEARRKKQQEEQMARRKKQQQQQEQQQKQRRKRKYMAQMDPQLRKRYGL